MRELSMLLLSYFYFINLFIIGLSIIFLIIYLIKQKWWSSLYIALGYLSAILVLWLLGFEYYFAIIIIVLISLCIGPFFQNAKLSRKTKYYGLLSVFLTIFLALTAYYFFDQSNGVISKPNTELTEQMIVHDVSLIDDEKHVQTTHVFIYPYLGNFKINNQPVQDGRYLDITTKDRNFDSNKTTPSQEVVHCMSVWLYLNERKLPYPIIGVRTSWSGWSGQHGQVLVTQDEFLDLYKNSYNDSLNKNEQAIKLANEWINKYKNRFDEVSRKNAQKVANN